MLGLGTWSLGLRLLRPRGIELEKGSIPRVFCVGVHSFICFCSESFCMIICWSQWVSGI